MALSFLRRVGVRFGAAVLLRTGAPGHLHAGLARTWLVLPSAYGDAAQQLAGIEIAGFDARNFPSGPNSPDMSYPLKSFPTRSPYQLPGGVRFRLHASRLPRPGRRLHGDQFLKGNASRPGWRRCECREPPRPRPFGDHPLEPAPRRQGQRRLLVAPWCDPRCPSCRPFGASPWRLHAEFRAMVAGGLPLGAGSSRGSMLEVGPTLPSSWSLALERRHGPDRTALALWQPLRAELGSARYGVPVPVSASAQARISTWFPPAESWTSLLPTAGLSGRASPWLRLDAPAIRDIRPHGPNIGQESPGRSGSEGARRAPSLRRPGWHDVVLHGGAREFGEMRRLGDGARPRTTTGSIEHGHTPVTGEP